MTRDDAQRLVQAYMKSLNHQSEGLNPQGFGGVVVGDAQLYFEYSTAEGSLEASALIYKFRDAPKPGILEGFQDEAKTTDTGGGKVDYELENNSLFLSRTYVMAPAESMFVDDMWRLTQASRVWGKDVLERVASRVFKR